ncbi:MAG: hypothetical protein OXH09_03630 [Gammaproteobacteria bacterium]|nr:hypothetical protein [Gammaproteobacteria bacterium]
MSDSETGDQEEERPNGVVDTDPKLVSQLARLPEDDRARVLAAAESVRQVLSISTSWSGPTPSPQDVAGYEAAVPGYGAKVLDGPLALMHAHAKALLRSGANQRLHTLGAIAIGLGMVAVGGLAVYVGNTAVAIIFGLAGLSAPAFRTLNTWLASRSRGGPDREDSSDGNGSED